MDGSSKRADAAKFLIGLLIVAAVAFFLASGVTPPGSAGVVVRHNHDRWVDATALFYSDLENMSELERGLAAERERAK